MITKYGWNRRLLSLDLRVKAFLDAPWSGGFVLLVSVVVAMLLANLPATAELYHKILETDLSLRIAASDGSFDFVFPEGMTVEKFINDCLMVIFFFSVGLEIKREIVSGQLSSVKRAILPVLAAVGGMAMPAIIYSIFNHGTVAANGWGIPTATDIAFAVGILSMMGDRVPVSLKVFLTALAIADDLGAIIVIALFYGGTIKWSLLAIAVVILAGIYVMNRMGETRAMWYLIPACVVWGLFYYSGIHSTMAGVVMAMLIPMKPRFDKPTFFRRGRHLVLAVMQARCDEEFPNREHRRHLRHMSQLADRSVGLSYRLEHALDPYITFLVMPIFALANAGVHIPSAEYFDIFATSPEIGSVGLGIFFGLLVGKPLGITLVSYVAVKCHLATMPDRANWTTFFAVACLGGIGFTMSIFVDTLAFPAGSPIIDHGKIAILMGSFAAAVVGSLLIHLFSKHTKNENS